MAMNFEEKLIFGREAEKEIELYFIKKGYHVIRSYDYTGEENNKSPKMFSLFKNHVLPDLDISKEKKRVWVEVKHYTYAPLNKKLNKYVHGIKKRHYNDYLKIEEITGNIVFLFIKERQSNNILYEKLNKLKSYPCQCGNCDSNCLIYFDREDFKEI